MVVLDGASFEYQISIFTYKERKVFLGAEFVSFFFFDSRSQYLARDSGRADLDIDDFVAKFIVNNLWCLNQYFFSYRNVLLSVCGCLGMSLGLVVNVRVIFVVR